MPYSWEQARRDRERRSQLRAETRSATRIQVRHAPFQGLGFKGLGFGAQGPGLWVQGSGFRVQGLGFGVLGFGFLGFVLWAFGVGYIS